MDTELLQRRRLSRATIAWLTAVFLLLRCPQAEAEDKAKVDPADLAKKPVTTAAGEVGNLLRKWWKEGTAAGNVGDFYDNRDGGHSDLDMNPYPQLQRIVYTAADIKFHRHWAGQRILLPHVVFGNSSTSAPFLFGGSNPRMYYTASPGLAFLYQEYTHNNVYIYPEHRDHDPGHNGANDGYGDAYPTNTPYLIISQGSSGSDQPFMRAIPFALAAFRPEVKKKLTDSGLLMPTLQLILRSSNRHLKAPEEYLTGKAHPTVFEGSWVNDVQMVQMCHAITLDEIPPMVRLKVVDEDRPILGKDFFETNGSEKLADTPASISRIFRGREQKRRLVISAEDSFDLNKRPLRFHWVVLRGDPQRIRLNTLGPPGDRAEIVISYHERRPIEPGIAMESNRVDIGVFAHNGVYYSAPAFVTSFSLDHEGRRYDDKGRVIEIGYGMGETALTVTDWSRFLQIAISDTFAGRLLRLNPEERASLGAVAERCRALVAVQAQMRGAQRTCEADLASHKTAIKKAAEQLALAEKLSQVKASKETKAEAEKARTALRAAQFKEQAATQTLAKAQKDAAAADQRFRSFLVEPLPGQKTSLEKLADRALRAIKSNPTLINDYRADFADIHAEAPAQDKAAFEGARKKLLSLGVIRNSHGLPLQLAPLRPPGQWTTYERSLLEEFNGLVLSTLVYPGTISSTFQVNYVDPRLSAPRTWRDVYRYDDAGHYLGWTRHALDGKIEFNPEGFSILKKDGRGRCLEGRTVRYLRDAAKRHVPGGSTLRQATGAERIVYEYDGDQDFQGRIKRREKMSEEQR